MAPDGGAASGRSARRIATLCHRSDNADAASTDQPGGGIFFAGNRLSPRTRCLASDIAGVRVSDVTIRDEVMDHACCPGTYSDIPGNVQLAKQRRDL